MAQALPRYFLDRFLLILAICKHSIFRHDNFIGCFSADKIKMSARK